eukprot:TRINITY_DN929_c0_g1_i1.p1 TRINITY_DN929_c0_g1~~TRINITY_DN929_c0_g1_i1.p1  ORF type:complete len:1748 (-),score=380.59 TRINITY_DN929_c0_g1_i1:311-5554(-)
MPPEHFSLDRKDFFNEKKYERSGTLAPSAARWRRVSAGEPRRTSGLCKQRSYQIFTEESDRGCSASQSSERTTEGDAAAAAAARPSAGRACERSSSCSSRIENKAAAFTGCKDWKGNSHHPRPLENCGGDASPGPNSSGDLQQCDAATTDQGSVDDLPVTHTSHTHSDTENSLESHSKDRHEKLGGVDGFGTGVMYDKDHSLGSITWKTLKWTRSGSFSSRSSGFGHSMGAKSSRGDNNDAGFELLAGKETPVRSLSGDGAEGAMTAARVEGACPQKKQRLGWGQGLAKYEKEKVEGPEDAAGRGVLVHCYSNTKNVQNTGALISHDKSPKVSSALECMSPATPCSVACSSSSGLEERSNVKVTNSYNDMSHFSDSTSQGFQRCPEELFANMEHLELNPISNISFLLVGLLSSQDASSGDSDFVQSTALNKLFLLKTDILKLLEKTECDIDLFENELKSLDFKSETNATCPTVPESIQTVAILKPLEKQADSAPKLPVKEQLLCSDPFKANAEVEEDDIDSPGTVTSKRTELASLEYEISASVGIKSDDHAADFEPSNSLALEGQCPGPFVCIEKPAASCDGEYRNCLNVSSAGSHVSSLVSQNDEAYGSLRALIFSSNKELAEKALEVFDKALPSNLQRFDIGKTDNSVCSGKSYLNIKEKLVMHKRFHKFKERVLTLKFKALHHLWIEDMRLNSLKKNRAKSQKRFDLSCRYSHSGNKKHRASIHSRLASPGNLTLVPTTETTDFTSSRLSSDSQIKRYRDGLKMPALILGDQGHSRFITNNGLVVDPCAVEKERAMINPWMPDEKEVFMEKLATFGKDFAKIASFLSHKTTADCIEFYYKNHKSETFEKVKKRLELRKQSRCYPTNTYMVTSGKKWNRDVNAASLGLLGPTSAVALHAGDIVTGKMYTGGCIENDGVLERITSVEVPGNETEAAAADTLASICGGLSSEAMSSCITSSVDHWEGCQEWKGQKGKSMVMEKPFTPEVSQNIDEDTFSDDSCGELESTDWTDEEKSSFIVALRTYGKDFASISKLVRTRSRDQCKIFFSKARKCLGLDLIHREPETEGTRMSDAGGGRSDTEDACVVEMDSTMCSMQSCSKIDVDMPLSLPNRCEESGNAENKDEVGRANPEEDTMKKKLEPIVQTGTNWGRAIGGDNRKLKKDDGRSGTVPEVLQMNAGTTVDAALSCNMSVPLLAEAGSFVDPDRKVYETDGTRLHVQVNSVHTEVQPELAHSTSYVVVKPKQEEQNQCRPYFSGEPRQEIKPGSCSGLLEPKSELPQLLVPETAPVTGLDDTRVPNRGADANGCNTSSQDLPDSSANRNSSLQEVDACPSTTSLPDHQCQTSLELLPSVRKFQTISWQQQENCPHGDVNLANSSNFNNDLKPIFEDQGNMHHQTLESSDSCQQYLPWQVFRGYPLRIMNGKEMNKHSDLIIEKSVQKISKISRDFRPSQASVQEKFDGSKSPVSVTELPLLPKSCERSEELLRSGLRGLEKQAEGSKPESEEKSLRTGDVKLFGQILSHLSPLQKVNSPQEKNDIVASPKSSQSFGFKFLEHGRNGNSNGLKPEASSYLGQQEFPGTGFGLWDGNKRMHNGLPLLSDSAMLSAINTYSLPTCQIDPGPLSAVFRRNDRVLGNVLGYPTKDVSGHGGLANHQVYQSYEGANVKPFSMDVKRQDHNGLETLLGFQRGTVAHGTSSVGGGIVVGGCTGVSDPVAAIKKHFANEAHSGARSADVIRENESWSGDVGR